MHWQTLVALMSDQCITDWVGEVGWRGEAALAYIIVDLYHAILCLILSESAGRIRPGLHGHLAALLLTSWK